MIKIKSISDVITNSSSEVFIIKDTKYTLEDISLILKRLLGTGYNEPNIIYQDSSIFKTLCSYEYIINCSNRNLLENYYIDLLYKDNDSFNDNIFKIDHNKFKEYISFLPKWNDFLRENILWKIKDDELRKKTLFSIVHCYRPPYKVLIGGLFWKFVEKYKIDLPEIKDKYKPSNFIGKKYFTSSGDNTIPYECWDKIETILNTNRYHLG